MNDDRQIPPTLALEDLEKKYFKNNVNYYTNKTQETTFDKFEFHDKDVNILRSQAGDEVPDVESPDPEEGLVGSVTDNKVDMEKLRRQVGNPVLLAINKVANDQTSLIYTYAIITILIMLWTLVLWLNYLSFSLLLCFSGRVYFAFLLAKGNKKADQILEAIKTNHSCIFQCDVWALIWTPVKGILLCILSPHHDWSPLTEYAVDHFPVTITALIMVNYLIQKKVAK